MGDQQYWIPTKIIGIELMIAPDLISISSSRYIESILIKEGLDKSNAVSTPLDPNITLVPNPEGTDGNRSNDYARILGDVTTPSVPSRSLVSPHPVLATASPEPAVTHP